MIWLNTAIVFAACRKTNNGSNCLLILFLYVSSSTYDDDDDDDDDVNDDDDDDDNYNQWLEDVTLWVEPNGGHLYTLIQRNGYLPLIL